LGGHIACEAPLKDACSSPLRQSWYYPYPGADADMNKIKSNQNAINLRKTPGMGAPGLAVGDKRKRK